MESIIHRGQNGERIFNLTSFHQFESWDKTKMNEMDGQAHMTWNQPSTKVYTLFEHGMCNNLHIEFFKKS